MLFSRSRKTKNNAPSSRNRRLGILQKLEDRQLLAGDAYPDSPMEDQAAEVGSPIAGDTSAGDSGSGATQTEGTSIDGSQLSLNAPNLPATPASGGASLRVAADGSAEFASIQEAIDAASAGDTITIAEGTYAEALTINGNDLTVVGEGNVTITDGGAGHGIYVGGSRIEINGVTVSGVLSEGTNGYGASGVVIAGQDIRLIDVNANNNGTAGFQTLESASNVLIQGGVAYNNSYAGLALGGGNHITVRGTEFYNTGTSDSGEGNFQYYGIVADNTGNVQLVNGTPTYIEDQLPMSDIRLEEINVHDHLRYGIRISAENGSLSTRPSGRIDTSNFALVDSLITDNGSETSSWVGGLYHHGGVLLQHIQGGFVAGNVIQGNYTWGVDVYNSSNVAFVSNMIVANNRGDATPDVTIQSAGLEINGGQSNQVIGNVIAGHNAGVFSSWIPDTGDDFSTEYAVGSIVIRNNIMAANAETDFELIVPERIDRTIENNLIQSMPAWLIQYIEDDAVPGFTQNNYLSVDPLFVDVAAGNFAFQDGSPANEILAGATLADPGSGNTDPGSNTDDSSPQTIRQLILGHSLINHFVDGDDPQNMGGTAVPYWIHQFASAGDNTYLVDGQWYSAESFNSGQELSVQWGFQGGAEGVWDSETPLGAADFQSVVLSPYNYIQQHAPADDVSEYLPLIDYLTAAEPGIEVQIYEGWPDMSPFLTAFPATDAEFANYAEYSLGDYQAWFDTLIDSLRAARPDVTFRPIEVNEALIGLLNDSELGLQGRLSGVTQTDLFSDDAPHGTETTYFLAAIATYSENFGQPIPADYVAPESIHPLVRANLADISEFIFQTVTDGSSTGIGDPSDDPGTGDPAVDAGFGDYLLTLENAIAEGTSADQASVRAALEASLAEVTLPISADRFWSDMGDVVGRAIDTLGLPDAEADIVWEQHDLIGNQYLTGEDLSDATEDPYPAVDAGFRDYLLTLENAIAEGTSADQASVRAALEALLAEATLPISADRFWSDMGDVVGRTIDTLGLTDAEVDIVWEQHDLIGNQYLTGETVYNGSEDTVD
ncbi:hypothetical protein Enr8_20350 [Blastopirellula retiformator]|uniref:Right handed beta helix domain-containing protein n=2 Tax=Blastopirellula retiformator TaxID=2527970 RepID=A0A5C5VA91_9BACT|nr:hypothetical protein Enr8_20350 [Blastopirellula retiformator]